MSLRVTPYQSQKFIKTIIVGDKNIKKEVEEIVKKHLPSMDVKTDSLAKKDVKELIFGRDYRVTLLDNTQLIPYSIKNPQLEFQFQALLASFSPKFNVVNYRSNGYGVGFFIENTSKALEYAKLCNLPNMQAKSCIEGGNCSLFLNLENQPSAIVGKHSLLLSFIALEEQGYFDENQDKIKQLIAEIPSPSDISLKMARNLSLYSQQLPLEIELMEINEKIKRTKDIEEQNKLSLQKKSNGDKFAQQWKNRTEFNKLLAEDIRREDREKFYSAAIELEAKFQLTEALIAEELKIPKNRIAFVPQRRLHIDMELFYASQGIVFIHDETSAMQLLTARKHPNRRMQTTCENYYKQAEKEEKIFKEHREELVNALINIQVKPVRVAGVFGASGEHNLNFMNGLVIDHLNQSPLFITNGSKNQNFLMDSFEEIIQKHLPKFNISFLAQGSDLMEKILTENKGGIHCLTWETNEPKDKLL